MHRLLTPHPGHRSGYKIQEHVAAQMNRRPSQSQSHSHSHSHTPVHDRSSQSSTSLDFPAHTESSTPARLSAPAESKRSNPRDRLTPARLLLRNSEGAHWSDGMLTKIPGLPRSLCRAHSFSRPTSVVRRWFDTPGTSCSRRSCAAAAEREGYATPALARRFARFRGTSKTVTHFVTLFLAFFPRSVERTHYSDCVS